jgi:hypothetical protein
MEFLELNQICEWARENALEVADPFQVHFPELPSKHHAFYSKGSRSGDEAAHARDLVLRLGAWEECVVFIREWGVWPSGEDWPTFYAWRGSRNERRSLEVAPGHRFGTEQAGELVDLLRLVMENAWDADVMCSIQGSARRTRARVSHDGWFEVLGVAEGAKS